MPTFDYSAYDAKGKLVDGVVTADSERQARRQLKEKKLLASKLTEVSKSSSKSKSGGRTKVNDFDLSLVLQQQAILIQSGLPT
jgi:general secretion pathway protein F